MTSALFRGTNRLLLRQTAGACGGQHGDGIIESPNSTASFRCDKRSAEGLVADDRLLAEETRPTVSAADFPICCR